MRRQTTLNPFRSRLITWDYGSITQRMQLRPAHPAPSPRSTGSIMPGFRSLAPISSLTSKDLWKKCIDDFLLNKLVENRLTGQARIQNAPARLLRQVRQSNAATGSGSSGTECSIGGLRVPHGDDRASIWLLDRKG